MAVLSWLEREVYAEAEAVRQRDFASRYGALLAGRQDPAEPADIDLLQDSFSGPYPLADPRPYVYVCVRALVLPSESFLHWTHPRSAHAAQS